MFSGLCPWTYKVSCHTEATDRIRNKHSPQIELSCKDEPHWTTCSARSMTYRLSRDPAHCQSRRCRAGCHSYERYTRRSLQNPEMYNCAPCMLVSTLASTARTQSVIGRHAQIRTEQGKYHLHRSRRLGAGALSGIGGPKSRRRRVESFQTKQRGLASRQTKQHLIEGLDCAVQLIRCGQTS